ncbi:MAG: hypothetical protein M3Z09_14415 [Acidobacteriota bacterium]|nr:hypothetical protein [Acidobacteriota bacterium]
MRHIAFAAAFLGASSFLSAADPALLNLIMPDAQVVAGVNIAKAKTSPFGQFVLRSLPANPDFDKFVKASGFDPRSELDEVVMASSGGHQHGLVIVRGTFNAAKISTLAAADGKHTVTDYNGAQLITSSEPNAHEAMAVLDATAPTLVLVGDLVAVRAAIDRRNVATPLNSALAAKIAAYSATDAWTVSVVPLSSLGGKAENSGNPFNGVLQGDLLKKVQETSGGVTFTSPVLVTGEAVADSDQDATALRDVVKLLASMVQTSGNPAEASVATLAKSLDVTTEGKVLKLSISIPEAQLEGLFAAASQRKERSKPGERI